MTTSPAKIKVTRFFFDRKRVTNAVDREKRSILSKSGAAVRVNAKRSMEQSAKAGRRPESSLPEDLRQRRKLANKIRKKQGRPRLKPLQRSSRPGQAPAASRSSPLNRLVFFSFDRSTQSVIVGPVGFKGSRVPEILEEGGKTRIGKRRVTIAPRPYMGPALRKEVENMPRRWRNSVRGG